MHKKMSVRIRQLLTAPILAIGLTTMGASLPVSAADDASKGQLQIELNKLEDADGGQCRVYLLLRNKTGHRFSQLQLDLVSLDKGGIIAGRLAVDVGPFNAGKVSVRLFDMPSLKCESIGTLLLNDVLACQAEGAEPALDAQSCLALIEPGSRTDVPFQL